jgi:hypothetical protein
MEYSPDSSALDELGKWEQPRNDHIRIKLLYLSIHGDVVVLEILTDQ